MATNSELSKVPVPVLNRSAFNKDHQNLLTMKVGTLTPVLVDELIPDSTIDLKAAALAKLPPLASDTFMRVKMHVEAFFVPFRILYGGFTRAMTGEILATPSGGSTNYRASIPHLNVTADVSGGNNVDLIDAFNHFCGPGSLLDYVGYKIPTATVRPTSSSPLELNIFPLLAYHRIYDDWYRNPLIQRPVFVPTDVTAYNRVDTASLPYNILASTTSEDPSGAITGNNVDINVTKFTYSNGTVAYNTTGGACNDGVNLLSLRQRNFGKDYFTSATPSPTVGSMPVLVVDSAVSGSSATGSFTIGALRSINSLTQFAERNALAGVRYDDWLKANYGVELSSQIEGRAQYLGRMVFDVYSKGVEQTGVSSSAGDVATQNPFKTVGAQYGNAVGAGEDTLCNNFYVREPGLLMVIASLVPKPTYSTGCDRYLRHYTKAGFKADLANQLFENVGPQPVYKSELDGAVMFSQTPDAVFGYTDRFAEYKTKYDQLHGLMRDGQSLESFALQRSVGLAGANLSSQFIAIPTDFLDQVSAVNGDISQYGCWMDIAFDYKVVQPLSRYSIPSLVMPAEHGSSGHTEMVTRSGSML